MEIAHTDFFFDPNDIRRRTLLFNGRSEIDRFWSFVTKTESCWIWTGTQVGKGYGYFRLRFPRAKILAHRYSYAISYGEDADGFQVCHHCDTPLCVRPEHLFKGTNAENVADMIKKDRHRHGENHHLRKVTSDTLDMIRWFTESGMSQDEIATILGLSRGTVYQYING